MNLVERLARTLEAMNTAFKALYLELAPEIVDDLRRRFDDYLQVQLEAQANREKAERKVVRDEALEEAARKCDEFPAEHNSESDCAGCTKQALAAAIRGMKSGSQK